MSWIAAAVGVGTALLGNSAARSAASQQADAAQRAQEAQAAQAAQARLDNMPFHDTGVAANARLRQLLGLDPNYTGSDSGSLMKHFSQDDLNNDPVYQNGLKFGLDQGVNGINARATQAGNFDSGATLKALSRYANDYGSTKANDAFNRFNTNQSNDFNRLSGISGTGQTATAQTQAAGTNATNQISDLMTQQGNAGAAGVIGGANAWGTAGQNYLNGMNNYNQNQNLSALMQAQTGYYNRANGSGLQNQYNQAAAGGNVTGTYGE